MWDMVERLRLSGLVVKRDVIGGRKYVYLNRQLPIYPALLRLLLALDKHWPAQRDGPNTARWYMPFDRDLTTERLDSIFQSPLRSRILLFVAAVGECNLETIYETLGLGTVSAMLAVNHWQRQGILRSRRYKRHRLVSLDPNFVAAKELRALLRVTVAHAPEYKGLRTIAQRNMRKIRKAAGPWPN